MENILGMRIAEARERLDLTQDQFGARYGVSGPAVFKFEKGYVKPSLELWLKIARDCNIPEKKAVLLWIRAKLPKEYQSYVDISTPAVQETPVGYEKRERPDYARIADPREIRKSVGADASLPAALRSLLADDEVWALYRPTGQEIQLLIEKFGSYSDAKESLFREALRLIRDFVRSEF